MKVQMSIMLKTGTGEWLKNYSQAEGLSMSSIVEKLLADGRKRIEKSLKTNNTEQEK